VSVGDEVPGDGVDEDCDGWADEFGLGEPVPHSAIRLSADPGERAGYSLATGTDADGLKWVLTGTPVNSPSRVMGFTEPFGGGPDLTVGGSDYYYTIGSSVEVGNWFAPFAAADEGGAGTILYAGLGDLDYERAVWTVVDEVPLTTASDLEVADIDGDGSDELIQGIVGGHLTVLSMPTPGTWSTHRLRVDGVLPDASNFAYQVGEVGDLTGDGLPEITVYSENDEIGGRAWILPGDTTGDVLITDVGWALDGAILEGQAGWEISLGDVTGDGYLDLLTGAFLANERAGVSYLVPGPVTQPGLLTDGIATFAALYPNDWCGLHDELLEDQDDDGLAEVVIGCGGDHYLGISLPGRLEIYRGADAVGMLDAHTAARVIVGSSPSDYLGDTISADEDLTGDGLDDLVFGAPYDDTAGPNAGAVYILQSPVL
jgi:hypothetical protein